MIEIGIDFIDIYMGCTCNKVKKFFDCYANVIPELWVLLGISLMWLEMPKCQFTLRYRILIEDKTSNYLFFFVSIEAPVIPLDKMLGLDWLNLYLFGKWLV